MLRKILCLLLLSFLCHAQVDYGKIEKYIAKAQKDWGVPGMAVGIVKDGKLVFSKGFGTQKEGQNIPIDANTNFAIASNSKAFTSAMIAMLVQEGKMHWEDKVKKHLPYFELYDRYVSENTTIEDLLSHRVGLGTFSGDIMWYNADFTAEEIIKNAKHLKPEYGFRDGWGYSNVMFITAGEIIRVVTGKSWYENVKERILDPLNMPRTFVNVPELEKAGNAAAPHSLSPDEKNIPIPFTSWEEIAATGGLFSNVNDLSKWLLFNLNHGIHGRDTLLSASSRNRLWNVHNSFAVDRVVPNDFGTSFSGYGLGWFIRDYQGKLRVHHTGGYDGMISSINMLPEENLAVIVLTNGLKAPINAIPAYIFDAFLERPEMDWSAKDLERYTRGKTNDTRIPDLQNARQKDTKASVPEDQLVGTYTSKLYGDIVIEKKNKELIINFSHTPSLTATLEHWHHDTYEMKFKTPHPWFTLALVKFTTNFSQKVTGIEFTVPNDDFWFEELNAEKKE